VERRLTFVLSGGGARGALQAGAFQALYEHDLHPDLVVGTSVGAINAAFLALHGFNRDSLKTLREAWLEASVMEFMSSNYLWLAIRALLNRDSGESYHRLRDFFISHGIQPDLRFGDVQGIKVVLVSSDLNSGQVVLHGVNPEDSILDGLLTSTALPPWVRPIETNGRFLVDGGFICNLPVEPAVNLGATEIIALDLGDLHVETGDTFGFGVFLSKVIQSTVARQTKLELEVAAANDVPVKLINLMAGEQIPIWDFHRTEELIRCGYEVALRELQDWHPPSRKKWFSWLPWSRRRAGGLKST
jgi:NTE family protein